LALSAHHKSQILKLDYDVAWTSFGVDLPGVRDALKGKLTGGIHFDVEIGNPTAFDVVIEKNRLEVTHDHTVVVETKLSPVEVAAGQTVQETIELDGALDATLVRRGRDLLDASAWRITLYLEVMEGFEFPVYLLAPER
jgi:hypothetical protein